MSKWRPEGWENKHLNFKNELEANPEKYLSWDFAKKMMTDDPDAIFEDGADAMLEALPQIKDYVRVHEDAVTLNLHDLVERAHHGTWYFIPDDPDPEVKDE